jgi:hypothetical protein
VVPGSAGEKEDVMALTLVFPRDRDGSATYASLAAQVEAGCAHIVQERRTGKDRRASRVPREHGQRGPQRRQAAPLPVSVRAVVTL